MLGTNSGLKRLLSYPRFAGKRPLRVLVLSSGYHLQEEAAQALMELGHDGFALNIRVGGPADLIRLLIEAMIKVKPDFVLLINHIGFDDKGGIGSLFEWLQMPLAIWYVDNPFFVIRNLQFPAPTVSSVFLWERSLLEPLRDSNVQDVSYLPLGCDLSRFQYAPTSPSYPVSFVGNSMVHADEKWSRDMRGRTLSIARAWRDELVNGRGKQMVERTLRLEREEPEQPAWDILASATFSATGIYRNRLLDAIDVRDLHIFGDPGWEILLPEAHLHGMVTYGPALAQIYRQSAINVNATSRQMPEAVNQRVFDVPAAGGFLLTDDQPALGELFDIGREVVTFADADELGWQVRHFQQRPEQRAEIAARGYRRVLREHSYCHRLAHLVAHMRKRHAPLGVAMRGPTAAAPQAASPC